MSSKSLIWGGMILGSLVGECIPYFWDGSFLAYTICGTIGGFLGIYVGFKLAKATGAF